VRRSSFLILAAALAVVAPSCIGGNHGAGGGDLRATRVVGAVMVQPPGESAHPLREGATVVAGSGLTTGRDAQLRMEDGGGRAVELAGDTRASVLSRSRLTLDLGSALGETGSGSMSFDSRGVGVRITGGQARLQRLLGTLRVGVYAGSAHVDMLGRAFDVPAYRQQDFAGGIRRDARPLDINPDDPWDRLLLGDVIELDRALAQFGRGFNAQFGGQAAEPVFFTSFVSLRRVESVVGSAPGNVSAADKLIGLVFAQKLAARDSTDARVSRYFDDMLVELQQGATWGLIAKERGLQIPSLLPAVLDAIRRGTTPAVAAGPPGGGGGGGSSPTPTAQPTTKPKPTPTASPTPKPSPTGSSPPCTFLDRLLGNCGGSQSSGTGSGGTADCSILGVLLDPKC